MSPLNHDLFSTPILALSAHDLLYLGWTWEGVLITGSPGSGKSACSGRALALGLLRVPRSGALILTAKSEETQAWIRYAKECGREKDLILFNAENGCFDPLFYEWTRPGRGAGDLESIIDLFSTLVAIGKQMQAIRRTPSGSGVASNSSEIP
jgi:hypothetical protein